MKKEYENDQRVAICLKQWDEKDKKKGADNASAPASSHLHDGVLCAFEHNTAIYDDEPPWSEIDKSSLPRQAFADPGEEGKKSTYKFPHHWVKGGTKKDEDGIWTDGTLYLHAQGWQDAINAAHGARSGKEGSEKVIAHLETHRSAVEAHRKKTSTALYEEKIREAMNHAVGRHVPAVVRKKTGAQTKGHVLNEACWAQNLGIWCVEPQWFTEAVALFRQGLYKEQFYAFYAERFGGMPLQVAFEEDLVAYGESKREQKPYILQDHVAVLPIEGAITKGRSSFGGASTLDMQRAVRYAVRDRDVHSILLSIDSPGGHTAGVQALADEVYRANQVKPVRAHIEDLGASAAYWVASQAGHITANSTADVGSIGTMAVVTDESRRFDRLGIAVHVISTGPYKGLGATGTPITSEALAYLQNRVDDMNEHFLASVQRGRRRMTPETLKSVADGRVHIAKKAHALGLIDGVASFEEAFDMMHGLSSNPGQSAAERFDRVLAYVR